MDDKLAELAAKDEIREKLYAYCRSVDRLDPEEGYRVFAEDSQVDYAQTFQGTGRGFIDYCIQVHAHCLYTSHQITNVTIKVRGDRAGSEAYCTAIVTSQNQEGVITRNVVRTRYNDQWERRGGAWFIVKRVTSGDVGFSAITQPYFPVYNSARDRSDPSYAALDV